MVWLWNKVYTLSKWYNYWVIFISFALLTHYLTGILFFAVHFRPKLRVTMVHGQQQMVKVYGLSIVVVFVLPRDSYRRIQERAMGRFSLNCSTVVSNCMWTRMTLRRQIHRSWILWRIFVSWSISMRRLCCIVYARDMPATSFTPKRDPLWWWSIPWLHCLSTLKRYVLKSHFFT